MQPVPLTRDHESAMRTLACERCPALEPAALADLFEPRTIELYGAFGCFVGDTLVGWSALTHRIGMPDSWRGVRVFVRRDHEARGIGSMLFTAATACLDAEAGRLTSAVFDDEERALAVARHWGLEVLEHSITSRLDLSETGPPPIPPPDVTVEECGDLVFDDEAAVVACLTASQTNPEAAAGLMIDLALLRGWVGSDEVAIGSLVRVDGRPVAISHGSVSGQSLHLTYTGVDPAFRGRGLAALAKGHAHAWAQEAGATESMTDNEADNTGIRHVNESLGYQPAYGTYWLRRDLV